MKFLIVLLFTVFACVFAHAGFEGRNGGTSLGISNIIDCGTGMTCSFTKGFVLNLSSSSSLQVGDGTAADAGILFDGNAQDYHITLDDSLDDLVIGLGSVAGVTDSIRIDENQDVTIVQDLLPLSTITGDGGGNIVGMLSPVVASTTTTITIAQCGTIFLSDSADVMTLPEASTAPGCRLTFVCGTADDFDINPNDATDLFSITGSITGANTTTVLAPSAGDALRCTDVGASIEIVAVSANLWAVLSTNGIITDVD